MRDRAAKTLNLRRLLERQSTSKLVEIRNLIDEMIQKRALDDTLSGIHVSELQADSNVIHALYEGY